MFAFLSKGTRTTLKKYLRFCSWCLYLLFQNNVQHYSWIFVSFSASKFHSENHPLIITITTTTKTKGIWTLLEHPLRSIWREKKWVQVWSSIPLYRYKKHYFFFSSQKLDEGSIFGTFIKKNRFSVFSPIFLKFGAAH